ncbi:uncharacterized protein BDZ99DRAFT_475104 [Mytilinidion resinicola]|uniref:Uncharacterized protein n=1 Tax=Mytilinidion resinicola TaxID=574789 RepID=A0A6A6YRJ7_9PEZI|nr:uncharacterized protein BDZ99DRAFT_475104 [Mytilinidion resinicola]KAF2811562.1 hypothetical protein BDZ99DRAFT_475104 [Mytilinidion resinicola]
MTLQNSCSARLTVTIYQNNVACTLDREATVHHVKHVTITKTDEFTRADRYFISLACKSTSSLHHTCNTALVPQPHPPPTVRVSCIHQPQRIFLIASPIAVLPTLGTAHVGMSSSHAADGRAAFQNVADVLGDLLPQPRPTTTGDSGVSATNFQGTRRMFKECLAEEARKYLELVLREENRAASVQSSNRSSLVTTQSNASSVQCVASSASSVSLYPEPNYEPVSIPPAYSPVRPYKPFKYRLHRPHDPGAGSGHSPPGKQDTQHQLAQAFPTRTIIGPHSSFVNLVPSGIVPNWYVFELEGAVELLREQLEALKKTSTEQEENAVIMTTHIGHMQQELREKNGELAILRGQAQKFPQQLSDMQDQLTMSAGYLNATRIELDDAKDEICGLEEELVELQKQKDEENHKKDQEIARLRKSNRMFMALYKSEKDRADMATEQAENPTISTSCMLVMQQKVEEKDFQIAQLQEQLCALQFENGSLIASKDAEVKCLHGVHWGYVQDELRECKPVIPKPKVVQFLNQENYENLPVGYIVENSLPVVKYGRAQVLTEENAPYTGPIRPATPLTQEKLHGNEEQNALLKQFWKWRNPVAEGLDFPDVIAEHFETLRQGNLKQEREYETQRQRIAAENDRIYSMSLPSTPVHSPCSSPVLSRREDTYYPDYSELPVFPELQPRTERVWSVEELENAYKLRTNTTTEVPFSGPAPITPNTTRLRRSQLAGQP